MEGDVIKATIEVDRQVFHNGDDWGIYSVLVDEVISDYKPVTDYKNRITIKGNMYASSTAWIPNDFCPIIVT